MEKTNQNSKRENIYHRGHREIIVLQKEKTLRTPCEIRKLVDSLHRASREKDKNSVLSVVKYSGVELCELCGLRVLIRVLGCGLNKIKKLCALCGLKNLGFGEGGSVCFYSFCFLKFDILFTEQIRQNQMRYFYVKNKKLLLIL